MISFENSIRLSMIDNFLEFFAFYRALKLFFFDIYFFPIVGEQLRKIILFPNLFSPQFFFLFYVDRYRSNLQDIDVEVELTANHLGRFEMYLCPNNNPRNVATQECFDR